MRIGRVRCAGHVERKAYNISQKIGSEKTTLEMWVWTER